MMPQNKLDLTSIFQSVTQALSDHQNSLNQADEFNHDHGDNMVQTFQTITNALQKKKTSSTSTALAYASRQVLKASKSASSQLYARNLAQASEQFKGKKIDERGALALLMTLIGTEQGDQPTAQPSRGGIFDSLLGGLTGGEQSGGQPSSQEGGGLLGSLLGGVLGGGGEPGQQPVESGGGLLSSLLGGLVGGGDSSGSGGPSGTGFNLIDAAMTFLNLKQSGGGILQALIQAFMAGNRMGDTTHRKQSTQIVINSFLQGLSSLSK